MLKWEEDPECAENGRVPAERKQPAAVCSKWKEVLMKIPSEFCRDKAQKRETQ